MSDATRDLVTNYLMTRPAGATVTGASTGPATTARVGGGAPALYARFCAACHGADGKGNGPNASYLPVKPAVHASREAMARRSDDALFDAISGGGAVMGKNARMPPFGATLTRAEISSLVRHIRELCRCRGPAWSDDRRAGTRAPQQR
jgi:mono/diheme cytochrome c family protein